MPARLNKARAWWRSTILRDTFLSCLGSFFAFLLVRWLSQAIYAFTTHFAIYIGSALLFTLLGLLISGSFRNISVEGSHFSTDRLFLTILVKEIGLTILMFTDKGGFSGLSSIALAIISDTLFSSMLIFFVHTTLARLREETLEMKELSTRPNTLVYGDDDDAALFAESAQQTGRYNLLGLLSRNPEMDRKIIRGFIIYYVADEAAMEALQWRLGGIDCILFPKGDSGCRSRCTMASGRLSRISENSLWAICLLAESNNVRRLSIVRLRGHGRTQVRAVVLVCDKVRGHLLDV